jgi:hypothetical protein
MSNHHPLEDPERLRLLLVSLHYGGERAWDQDPEAAELMSLTVKKYAGLAAKHHRDADEAAAAAWGVMRTRAARIADDPWAVITHSVALQMYYEERAQGLLCGADQVRTSDVVDFHDADRISDHETNLADFHPSFWSFDDLSEVVEPPAAEPDSAEPAEEPTNAFVALETAIEFFVDSGWPRAAAQLALECIAARLIRTGNKHSTFESLRRDSSIRRHLDIDQDSWIAVLRAVLGHDHPALEHTAAGRGILKRLLTGERFDELFDVAGIADVIADAAPRAMELTDA